MLNFDKIYVPLPSDVSLFEKFFSLLKTRLAKVFSFCLWFLSIVLFLLLGQALVVGVADRMGISLKFSLIFSSLFYVSVFSGLALLGTWPPKQTKVTGKAKFFSDAGAEPVCKILIIKQKVINDE